MFKKFRQLLIKFLQWLLGYEAENTSTAAQGSISNKQSSESITPSAQLPVAKIIETMSSEPPQYQLRKSLCTYSERVFYEALRESVGREYLILIKVRMGDIMWLENEKDAERDRIFKTQIWGKHLDFLLCNKWTLEPLLAIELDDKGHRQYDRRESDEFKNKALAIARLPLLRVNVQKNYPRQELREKVFGVIDHKAEK